METLWKLGNLYTKHISLVVIIVVAIALFSSSFKWATKDATNLLCIAMFGTGMTLKTDDFKLVLHSPANVLIGIIAQFTIMPVLAYILAILFRLPPELAVGVILVGTCLGNTSSNVMTYLPKGDVALSAAMAACASLLEQKKAGLKIE